MAIRPFLVLATFIAAIGMAPLTTPMLIAADAAAPAVTAGVWGEDYKQALAESKQSGKPILADFTGTDWCSWCIKLKKDVFDQPEFKEWATKNVILLRVDFPNQKVQAAALKEQNDKLLKEFGVEGFPTVLIIDGTGKRLGELGYIDGGSKTWIAVFNDQFVAATKK